MGAWLNERVSDGFNVMFFCAPSGVEEFADLALPELQQRAVPKR